MGGTANNMFQVAAVVGTADRMNCDYYIPVWDKTPMFAGEFVMNNTALPIYHEPTFHYTEINKTDIELFGYFQSAKYFEHCEQKIRNLFAPAPKVLEKIKWKYGHLLKKQNTCSLHIRRGDYLTLSEYHYNLETEYYTTIMKMFPAFHYVCFSDDIEWCKQNIPAQEFIHDSVAVDLHLMSMMRNHIIANSSFSWWSSFLCPYPEKMIFSPPKSKWFGVRKSHLCVDDLFQDNWIYSK